MYLIFQVKFMPLFYFNFFMGCNRFTFLTIFLLKFGLYYVGVPMPCTGLPAPPPPQSARPHLNLRGLVFNFINKKFLWLFLFSVADYFSRTKSFIDINVTYKPSIWLNTPSSKSHLQDTLHWTCFDPNKK
jgi:hypothetical protein